MLRLIYLLLTFILSVHGQVETTTTCDNTVDIVFVIDFSGSLGVAQYESHRQLVKSIAEQFDLDDKLVARIGLVVYDAFLHTAIEVGVYNDKADALSKIDAASSLTGGSSTATGDALDRAYWLLVAGKNNDNRTAAQQSSLRRIIILFTDGVTTHALSSTHPCSPFFNPFTQAGCDNHVITQATNIKNGQYSGSSTDLSVNNSDVLGPNGVFIFVGFVNNVSTQSSLAFTQAIASTPQSKWWRNIGTVPAASDTQAIKSIADTEVVQQICESSSPTPSPSSGIGDIHFQTTDGVMYTFNGAGDYVYLSTDKLNVHIRAAMVGKATTLAAMALKDTNTKEIIELWWNGIGADALHVNLRRNGEKQNREIDIKENAVKVGQFLVWRNEIKKQILLQHELYNHFNITANYGGRASFATIVPNDWKTKGLGGNNNGYKGDDICDRKGSCVSLDATNRDVHDKALDWKVLPDELIFEKWMPVNDWELRYHPLEMTYEQLLRAKQLCGNIQQCIFDYISVGKKEYALLTRKDYLTYQKQNKKYIYVGDHL